MHAPHNTYHPVIHIVANTDRVSDHANSTVKCFKLSPASRLSATTIR